MQIMSLAKQIWAFYEIKALKDNTETLICLTRPKIIAEIIFFLLDNTDNPFKKGL